MVAQPPDVAEAIVQFGGDPASAGALAEFLGFQPVAAPVDLLAGRNTALREFFDKRTDRFGVEALYRVGGCELPPASVGLYVAVLTTWGTRASDKDRARRRLARALVELRPAGDHRGLLVLVPNETERGTVREAELVLPRVGTATGRAAVSTVRAQISLEDPNRFHRDLLRRLVIRPEDELTAVLERWQHEFSVERATRQFHQEYADIRNALADALADANAGHPVVSRLTDEERRAWATRQLGRVLFLWFLQSKRWLGYEGSGEGRDDYLVWLWNRRHEAQDGYYRGMLVPLFFQAMAQPPRSRPAGLRDLLGDTPYLNGGLFRRSKVEDDISDAGEVTLPDELFDPGRPEDDGLSVLRLLRRYRFTTRESTPDDQSVDPDPELLGRVFENLYQGDERKATGTYYTPREIVHFMCRQVLDGYLRDRTGVQQELLDELRNEALEPGSAVAANGGPLPEQLRQDIETALDNVRVVDPAVGSGAFLVGMMHEMVQLRRGLAHAFEHDRLEAEPQREDALVAGWKYQAVSHSLYGVDINPEAVEICHLRLWLSLVLDQQDAHRVDPLPNLDFRVVAGDSLVDRVAGVPFRDSIPAPEFQLPLEVDAKLRQLHERLEKDRATFEATHDKPPEQSKLRDRIERTGHEIVRLEIETHLERAREELKALERNARAKKSALKAAHKRVAALEQASKRASDEHPYQRPFLWKLAFPEVFRYGGFDIALANPPYIRQEKLAPGDQEAYSEAFPEVYAGTADILVFFYARALEALREDGWLAFITSNKYMRAGYGEEIREYLPVSLRLERVIDFGDLPLFDVAAYPAVVVGRKSSPSEEHRIRVVDLTPHIRAALTDAAKPVNSENVREALEALPDLLRATEVPDYPQVLLKREGWILEDPALVRLFNRLMNEGTPLSEYTQGRIYYGIKTGLNEAFVIDQKKRDELVAADPRSAELIKPWLRGRDIKRWRAEWAGLYVIFTGRGRDIEQYPAIKAHLEAYREPRYRDGRLLTKGLEPLGGRDYRKPGSYSWFEPQDSIAYYSEFEQPKVAWATIADRGRFAFLETAPLVNQKAYIGPGFEKSDLPILNSNVFFAVAGATRLVARQHGYYEWERKYMIDLPLPPYISPDERRELTRLVDAALVAEGDALSRVEDEVNAFVAALYRLTSGEQRLLDGWIESRLYVGSVSPDEHDDE